MKKNRCSSLKDLHSLKLISSKDKYSLQKVVENFAISLPISLAERISKNPDDPLYKQFVPDIAELDVVNEEIADPIGDLKHSPVKGIVHRHSDRCLFMVVNVCAVYCRFCFRREKIGPGNKSLTKQELNTAIDYIANNKQIWEVILSGGDPLIISANKLAEIIASLNKIVNVQIIRIHTRIPIVEPQRINEELLKALQASNKTIYIVLHVNHSKEINDDVKAACQKLINNGVILLSQSVLLKGINNSVSILTDLFKTLVVNRIKPYYLHHCDLARGTKHFRVSIKEGQEIMKQLRSDLSGLCLPNYVLDIPGGYGKVPVDYVYLNKISKSNYSIEDIYGCSHDYSEGADA